MSNPEDRPAIPVQSGATGAQANGAAPVTTCATTMALAGTTSHVRTIHQSLVIDATFERFTAALQKILGHFPPDVERDFTVRPRVAAERIKAAEGAQSLMIFSVFDHGAALNMVGATRNAKQYLIGNPLTAASMTRFDIRAALYAPLRVLVYEQTSGCTVVEYDRATSLFGQFERAEVSEVARALDEKLERVLLEADELSRS